MAAALRYPADRVARPGVHAAVSLRYAACRVARPSLSLISNGYVALRCMQATLEMPMRPTWAAVWIVVFNEGKPSYQA